MKVSDVLTGILLGIFGLTVFLYAQTFPDMPGQDVGPSAFPGVVGAGFVVCGLLLVRRGLKASPRAAWFHLSEQFRSWRSVFRFLLVPLVLVLYVLFSGIIGFIPFAFLFLLVLQLAFETRPLTAFIVSVVGSLAIFYIFYSFLHVPLSWGLLEPLVF